MRTVTFSADDFGLHPTIDEAILKLAEKGVVRATSVLVTSPNFSADRMQSLSKLGVSLGAHLAFTEVRPLRPELFHTPWIRESGEFLEHWSKLWKTLLTRRIPREALLKEWSAQLEKLRDAGAKLQFLDTHQNLHMLPGFSAIVVRLAHAFHIPGIRVFGDSLRLKDPLRAALVSYGQIAIPKSLALQTYGAFASCNLSEMSLREILGDARREANAFTIMVHPGTTDVLPKDGLYHPNYALKWKQEFELLSSPRLPELLGEYEVELFR